MIGTSASIQDDAEGRAFLSEFFARQNGSSFTFIKAENRIPDGADDLGALAAPLLAGELKVDSPPNQTR